MLAVNDIDTPASLRYLFRLLDFNKQGGLDQFTVYYFLKGQVDRLKTNPANAQFLASFKIEDFLYELFDMAHPVDPTLITLGDLLKCGVGGTVVSLMVDIQALLQNQYKD